MKLAAAIVLLLLGVVMIFIGLRAGIPAPSITGLGFCTIAAVFIVEWRSSR